MPVHQNPVPYAAPLRDMKFVMRELLDGGKIHELAGFEEATPDLIDAILEESAKYCVNEMLPLNRDGDEIGCQWDNGVVRTPPGFKEAYDKWVEGGWQGLSVPQEFGGQGLPHAVSFLMEEMMCSTNMAFAMYPGLTTGAINALIAHGSEAQKATYLPKMTTGEWSGTMCLTEPHCGTDLGLMKTRAEPLPDGSYALSGQKIFISAGEHDLTENIVHLVLAKLPDAPAGSKGISLFLVPKFLPDADGNPGVRNGVMCTRIEEKMGIHGNSTAVLMFDQAKGSLIGEVNKGLEAMFVMMNAARMGVGVQGQGICETAYQAAVSYAKDRLQMRSLSGKKAPDKPADPIIVHPDVRRMLMKMKATSEGNRAFCTWIALALDKSFHAPSQEERRANDDLVQLMTPIIKAYMTDQAVFSASDSIQVLGGHGYVREWGREQMLRDAKIAQIYEGTNGIQALDLVGRKLGAHFGRYLKSFFHPVTDFIEAEMANPDLKEFIPELAKTVSMLQEVTQFIALRGIKDPEEAGAASTDYLRLFALTAMAYLWAKTVKIAKANLEGEEKDFYEAKIMTAQFFYKRMLPEAGALRKMALAGKDTLMQMPENWFDLEAA